MFPGAGFTMAECSEDREEVSKVLDFYINLVENNNSTVRYYLAENVVLDWFGKTVKEVTKVSRFMKDQVGTVTHYLTSAVPVQNVAFKNVHKIKATK